LIGIKVLAQRAPEDSHTAHIPRRALRITEQVVP
jgi:hypothetical protein